MLPDFFCDGPIHEARNDLYTLCGLPLVPGVNHTRIIPYVDCDDCLAWHYRPENRVPLVLEPYEPEDEPC